MSMTGTGGISVKREDSEIGNGISENSRNEQSSVDGNTKAESSSVVNGHFEDESGGAGGVKEGVIGVNEQSGQVLPEQPDLKIIRRQISGFVGFANLPKQWHRKSIRRGFNFNLLCVSQKGLGKSTLINTLFNRDIEASSEVGFSDRNDEVNGKMDGLKIEDSQDEEIETDREDDVSSSVKIKSYTTTIEENGVNLKLCVVDTPGFGDAIDNTGSWKPIADEVNYRFDQYLDAENKINRSLENDNRIHACLYFIEPTAHYLKPLDVEFCKQVHEKCNLIPIIAKSDILTEDEITVFKQRIRKQLDEANVKFFQPPTYAMDDPDTVKASNDLFEKIPYAVVGSNSSVTNKEGKTFRGRSYPWGIIDVDNAKHCDFVYLRDLLISQYLEELRERTNNVLYENYRSQKLIKLGIKQDNSVFKEFDPESKQREEKQLHEAKLAKLEAEMKTVFHQKVSEKEKKLQKSEAELFARHKEMKEKLTKQLKALEEKKHQLEISISNQPAQSPAQTKKKGFLR
ncbi:hypothetical protein HG537_0C03730 [Torulaspora globosa]|uniref:Septin-type G domain-containing protein n=1 Tax=Torulaspora globosa TaxID=48254 RepID=A0A7H9HTJ2_9SACH|nr:hypothetical protein HG537_0C03730 [Torulaspora sp. CBS 2947]